MSQDGVSPAQGQEPFARSVTAPAHSVHSSRPTLFSQFHGPFLYNETDDERKKREEDEEKKSNFKKVQEKAEREEAARKAAEAELEKLRKEKADREAADKKAAEAKLTEQQEFQKLAEQKDAEAKAKADEAAKEKARADAAETKLKAIADQQEKDLEELLKTIPEDKLPPLDPTDPVEKRLAQVKHVKTLIDSTPKGKIGAGVRNQPAGSKERLKELQEKRRKEPLSQEESMELMELTAA